MSDRQSRREFLQTAGAGLLAGALPASLGARRRAWRWGLATPEPGNTQVNNQQDELCGIRGDSLYDLATTQPVGSCATGAVNTAWNVTTWRPDVVISVLDSAYT